MIFLLIDCEVEQFCTPRNTVDCGIKFKLSDFVQSLTMAPL